MHLLTPGTGNQNTNRAIATAYICASVIDNDSFDLTKGNITATDGTRYKVSAYAETPAAFVSTPGTDKSKNSIYESGLSVLMFRQMKRDNRSFVYEVAPSNLYVKPNTCSAKWVDVDKAADRIWVCTKDSVKLFDRRK
ncbi:MAG TPA: hypothetical protein EYO59_06400 [Chromatiaceae bacterium]|jgi:hypothetical protein|nr:hypothetical protein [Chromatiaceae bacterium]